MIPMSELELEGSPEDDQKVRLQGFLTELMLITRRYGLLLMDQHESIQILDLRADGRLVGVGLAPFTAPGDDSHIIGYEAADSILDGTWLVDTVDGPVEQQRITNVFPRRTL